ncbi:MAG: transposase [candidate division Zixibacteria bacterium]|nr:transposase [candidate division Zixibacteria bacterium]
MIAVTQENSSVHQQTIAAGEALDLQHLLQENQMLRCERNGYKSLLERATAREQLLKQEIQQLNARIRYLEKRLYGRRSEKHTASPKNNSSTASSSDGEPKRSRGHQPGSPGHGRRDYSHLPVKEEIFGIDEAVCPHCGCPYQESTFLGTEDSELIEVEVRAYRRNIRRKKYKKGCQCQEIPGIITAPGPSKLIDKGKLGISVWVTVLLEKYLYQRPINRLLESFKDIEFDMAAGTIGDGLKKLAPFFEPVLQQIIQKNQTERHMHADETRWQVFEFIEGKKSYRWHMWVFVSNSAVVYLLDPSRAASVLENHLKMVSILILSVDRFVSYK